ncbi:copper chaperone PCu(A)C [Falsirhodobacter xinxiangensis]|uniref:copper chaperone PCu(A)C n=1 Tax=Falsirhodobacter xinxiangensis TaxID=2530049 RepID=UPI0010AA25A0|nr:copper chaperone PCu(A)C [Rhodobacter xinxiangensis]
MKTIFAAVALSLVALPSVAQDIEVREAFARATLPNAPVAGGYLTVANHGDRDDRLTGARADFAGEAQIHEMTHSGDVMRMRELPDGVAIPAGQEVHLSTGSNHLMFMRLNRGLVQGDTVTVTLTFEKAGDIDVPFIVGPINARSFDDDGSGRTAPADHGGHSH